MIKNLFFKMLFATVKAGVKQDIDSCTSQLQLVKAHMTKPGMSFGDSIWQESRISETDFYHHWAREIVTEFLRVNTPKYSSQLKFVSEELPHQDNAIPETIAELIVRYKNSEFSNMCKTLESRGDSRGSDALDKLKEIIMASYKDRGFMTLSGGFGFDRHYHRVRINFRN